MVIFFTYPFFLPFPLQQPFQQLNPNKYDRERFTHEELDKIWDQKDDKYYQIVLMLIYNGVRITEFLDLKKENVHLDEQYFDVISSKTVNITLRRSRLSGVARATTPDKQSHLVTNYCTMF